MTLIQDNAVSTEEKALTLMLQEILTDSDSESDVGQSCFKEETIEKVMQELYKEIIVSAPSPESPPPTLTLSSNVSLVEQEDQQDELVEFEVAQKTEEEEFKDFDDEWLARVLSWSQDVKFVFRGGSSDNQQVCNAWSTQPKLVMADQNSSACGHLAEVEIEDQENRRENHEYEKLLSSNVSLTRKMMSPPNNNLATKKAFDKIRVCADCNTTSTPLWRSGPNGPKRKARRAMAEAANSSVDAKSRLHHQKEKKCRRNHFAGFKNKFKTARGTLSEEQKVRIDLKDFSISLRDDSSLKQEFPMDEVAQAAMLLMDLSRGFLYL
ncbi:hypothetical protein V8G54_006594 [Vigna mungo]|uniref:GATA-type domain-containing protein n=1 Tax=Vigna mungo TaxID=3915 RepID=A0AAQ3P276_VIGMU